VRSASRAVANNTCSQRLLLQPTCLEGGCAAADAAYQMKLYSTACAVQSGQQHLQSAAAATTHQGHYAAADAAFELYSRARMHHMMQAGLELDAWLCVSSPIQSMVCDVEIDYSQIS
jgi:hypothetical protein